MNPNTLTQMYDDIKKDSIEPAAPSLKITPGGLDRSPGALVWRNKAAHHAAHLKDKCRKHILLDLYCKIIPLDKEWVDDNQGVMKNDIDSMLAAKDMDATQYFMSAYESTNSPFVEYILRSTDMIGRTYMEEQEEVLKDAQEKDIDVPEPRDPEVDDDDVEGALVDVSKDTEYEDFVDKLRKKTVDKIVNDITKIIEDKKEENDMTFESESAVAVSMDYLQKQNWGAELTESQNDDMIGMAIREATLHEFDLVFNQPLTFREFATNIRMGKGAVINESAVNIFKDSVAKSQESAEEKKREEMSKFE